MTSKGEPRSQHTTERPRSKGLSNVSLGLTIVAVLAVGIFLISQGLRPNVAAQPTSSAPPGESAEASSADTSTRSPDPMTAQPSTGLVGVFPGPDARIPQDAPPLIPNLRIEALAAAAEAEGMKCESLAGTDQEGSGGYTLACEGQDPAGHAMLSLSVAYFTLDGVWVISFSVWPDAPGAVASGSTAAHLMSSIGRLASGEVTKSWILARLDDGSDRETYSRTEGPVRVEVQIGVNGGRGLYVLAADN